MDGLRGWVFAEIGLILTAVIIISCGGGKSNEPAEPNVPTVITATVSDITDTSATCGGTISSDGGAAVTRKGVCWSTDSTPSISDDTTDDGSGTGSFTSSVLGLSPGTPYYVRAYATNSKGTGYGEIRSFNTLSHDSRGTIIIDTEPDSLEASWTLAGPGGFDTSGYGDEVISNLVIGEYAISWDSMPRWIPPADSSETLAENDTITFTGVYVWGGGPESTGTVTDIDGNVYQTVKIGDQWWMMENLKVTHYRNGDPIPHITNNGEWAISDSGAYCNYNNDSSNVSAYGRLYNWLAVVDSRHLPPAGWHIPSDDEWKQLERYLGMSQSQADTTGWRGTDEGGKLKETGTAHWGAPNTGATNSSYFTARPGGYRDYSGWFYNRGYFGAFWTSTPASSLAWYRGLYYDRSTIDRGWHYRTSGISVRCVKD